MGAQAKENDLKTDASGVSKDKSPVGSGELREELTPRVLLAMLKRETYRPICSALIIVALAVGFGKILAVDSLYDRAIQNYRLNQLPKQMEERLAKLREKNLSEERFNAEAKRIYEALYRDATKARPTLSANDRSRWATIRALVEKDARVYRYTPVMTEAQKKARVKELTRKNPDSAKEARFKYLPGEIFVNCKAECPERFDEERAKSARFSKTLVPYAIDKAWETPGWDSIDVVKHGLRDEVWDPRNPSSGYLYSSKPTLLPTVMAAPYWILYNAFGLSLQKDPFLTARILLVVYNLIPLAVAFCCVARVINLLGRSNWSKVFALLSTLFGFFTLTFVATLNNHIPGFVSISIALWAACEIICLEKRDAFHFFCAGFFGAFAVACELPALAFAGLLCVALLVKAPKKTTLISIPAGLIVVAAFFATNYVAHQTFVPAYAHKRDHMALKRAEIVEKTTDPNAVDAELLFDENDWYYYVYYPAGRPRAPRAAALSHWANRTGVDRGEPSIGRYAFHSTIGLRGVFSLTPIWFLSLAGIFMWLFEKERGLPPGAFDLSDDDKERYIKLHDARMNFTKALALIALLMTIAFFAFFLTRDQGDRNYGGVCCCPRWFFPLAPLFLPCLLPALDWLSTRKWGRALAYCLLFWSVVSAFYPTWNPWISPWPYQLAVDGGLFQPY